MLKRTLYFGNPSYLSLENAQMVIRLGSGEDVARKTVPIEDVAYVILDNNQITITKGLMSELLAHEVALITCDERHMPCGLNLPLESHTLQSERFRVQIEASAPLKKQLWKQTVQAKIANQAELLGRLGIENRNMLTWVEEVRSGDTSNLEARAAVYYWRNLFPDVEYFVRDRFGPFPNNLLNYGYAILRAIIARGLVSSGLLPTFGIHHRNRYNAYCLADDIMEPYRPVVDNLVADICRGKKENEISLSPEIKRRFLSLPVADVTVDGHRSPLMVAASTTCASLYKCFEGEARQIIYPRLC